MSAAPESIVRERASNASMRRPILLLTLLAAFAATAVACGGSAEALEPAPAAPTPAAAEPPDATRTEAAPIEPVPAAQEPDASQQPTTENAAGDTGQVTAAEPDGAVAGESVGELPPEDTSRPLAPELAGTSLDGAPLSTADFRGRPVFVVFFAWH